ncbi:hypothetical protein CHH83_02040 [Bacillus sp. 7586-K]|nr:hypothetical protein CHH83_02040 [Bacillus sp. 7586-K]
MAVIEILHKTETFQGRTIQNIPYKKHDHACWEGCCENMLSMSLKDASRTNWLIHRYMPNYNLQEFDYLNDWNEKVEKLYMERKSR